MEAIAFAVLLAAACVFLVYVFVNFGRELRQLRQSAALGSEVVPFGTSEEELTREVAPLLVRVRTHSASA